MIATWNNKSDLPEVSNPKDIRLGIVAAAIVLLILFIILFFFTYKMMDPPPMDVIVKTETTLEELELKELVVENPGGGGSDSPTDASPSPTDAQQVLTGQSSTSTTQTGKPDGDGEGDNPFGKGGFGGRETVGFGPATGPDNSDEGDGTTCDSRPINYSTIKNLLENNVPVTKPTSVIVTIKIKADGSVSSVSVSGIGGAEASVENRIKEIVKKSQCTKCNGKNKNSRSFTFPTIKLIQN
jgi:hypothetical protein